jgi:hypothetical protein
VRWVRASYVVRHYRVRGVVVRGIIHAAHLSRTHQPVRVWERKREEKEGAQGLARPHLLCLSDTDTDCTAQLCVLRVEGGIELVPLLTADVGVSVPFSSVDR